MGVFRAIYAAGKVAFGAGASLIAGASATAVDACRVVDRLAKQDWEGSLQIVGERAERTVLGAAAAFDNGLALLEDLAEPQGDFLREENIRRMTSVASLGMASVVGVSLFEGDGGPDGSVSGADADFDADGAPSDTVLAANFGLSPDAVENGVFVGDESDLTALIEAGQDPNAVHLDAESITRDIGVRDAYLAAHGYDSVPEGFEVHHVLPLCEGGADSPDNMILVSESDHDRITAAHRAYYGWTA